MRKPLAKDASARDGSPPPAPFDPFVGDSEMAARMRAVAWEQTELGPVERWSHALRSAVSLCLLSRLCSCIYCGNNHLLLYNDAFASLIENKHAWGLMRPAAAVLPEIFDIIGPLMQFTLRTGRTTGGDDAPIFINRHAPSAIKVANATGISSGKTDMAIVNPFNKLFKISCD